VSAVGEFELDDDFLTFTDFLTPKTLYLGTVGPGATAADLTLLRQLPEFFDAMGLEVTQFHAVSKDGASVPYFQVARKGLKLDGSQPTLLYGYGGFEVSETPAYSATIGSAWLEQGGGVPAGQHPGRRRIRPALARGRTQGEPSAGLR
jgi:prolyl oligopeptidase